MTTATSLIKCAADPEGIIDNAKEPWSDKARQLLGTQALVVVRQLEMMNLFIGFEQANKCVIFAPLPL
jgi:hypothetical protein